MKYLKVLPKTILSIFLILAVFTPALLIQAQESAKNAAPSLAAQADARLSRWFKADQPGAVVLLVQDGKVLFKKGYGLANVELGVTMQPDMLFRIGAVTQQFTAAAVMLLAEEGKVDLAAPIARYLEKLPRAWRSVTVEQLLNHTSGIPDFRVSKNFWEHRLERITPNQLLELYVVKMAMDFEPGTQHRYTYTGYILLGMIIEKVTGQSYARFLQKRLFEPLGLKHTHYDEETQVIPGLVSGYYSTNPKPAPFWSVTQKYSAVGLVSNAEDLAQWTLALHGGKVVNSKSLARMLRPTRLANGKEEPYGFGLAFRQSQGDRLVGQAGEVYGFDCFVEADPAIKAVAVILNNTFDPKCDRDYFSRFLLALAAGKPLPEIKPVAIESSKLKRLTGWYKLGMEFRIISFDGKNLFSRRRPGAGKYMLIPLSETEFSFDDSDHRLRFELAGDKVIGLYRRFAVDVPEQPIEKRMEPLEDKDPKVVNMVQQGFRDLVAGTLKPDLFTPDLETNNFSDRVNEAAAFVKELGPLTGIVLYAREERSGGYKYVYRVSFGEKSIVLPLWIAKDGRVGSVSLWEE
ncbi:MAG: class A beta-lactamase-related serine hydrolase [Desulfobacteraceae bacterium]|nr:MAG: class A beta-lactamase-related serine hydrolase [Desulfobacteraceae bacterium]